MWFTPKIVYSSTLEKVDWNSRLVTGDIGDELVRLRQEFQGDMEVAGATLAGSFVRRGLIDEYHLIVHPVAIGSGTPFFPPTGTPIRPRLTFAPTDVVKLVTYVVGELDAAARRQALDRAFGDHLTTSTLLYVARLAAPQYLVEVDAWAVRQ